MLLSPQLLIVAIFAYARPFARSDVETDEALDALCEGREDMDVLLLQLSHHIVHRLEVANNQNVTTDVKSAVSGLQTGAGVWHGILSRSRSVERVVDVSVRGHSEHEGIAVVQHSASYAGPMSCNVIFGSTWLLLIAVWVFAAFRWKPNMVSQLVMTPLPSPASHSTDDCAAPQKPQSPEGMYARDAGIDEVKFHLMTLVIFGHLMIFWDDRLSNQDGHVFRTLSVVHMPAFTLVSGMFSKGPVSKLFSQTKLRGACVDLLGGFLVGSLVTNMLYLCNEALAPQVHGTQCFRPQWPGARRIEGVFTGVFLASPEHGPWYLLALFWWRLVWCPISSVLWQHSRLPLAFLAAVAFGSCGRFDYLALDDCFLYLPFFEIGLQLTVDDLNRFSGSCAACVSALIFVIAIPLLDSLPSSRPWVGLLITKTTTPAHDGGIIFDALKYAGSLGLTLLALGLLLRITQIGSTRSSGKNAHTLLTGFGRQTLYAYGLHRIVLIPIGQFFDFSSELKIMPESASIPLLFFVALLFNGLLSTQFSKVMFGWLCQPGYLFAPILPDTP